MTTTAGFGARLELAFHTHGQLCVGIDPHPYLLGEWGLPDSADGLREFGLRVVDATAGRAGIVKPQVAFFERHGAAGYSALELVLSSARAAGLIVIGDAKRGDIGTSVDAYGQAWLTPGLPLEVDAMTVNAYQGVGAFSGVIELARASGKGMFFLAATSNAEAEIVQSARLGARDTSVAAAIVKDVNSLNADGTALGSFGVVIGATVDAAHYGINSAALTGLPILSPGFGHQGARFDEIRSRFGDASAQVIVSASRSILAAGPTGISEAVSAQAAEVAECLG